jgi:hypothetical protein
MAVGFSPLAMQFAKEANSSPSAKNENDAFHCRAGLTLVLCMWRKGGSLSISDDQERSSACPQCQDLYYF